MKETYKRCNKCIMDTTDPDIEFDDNGVCNHCRYYDEVASKNLFLGKEGEKKLYQIGDEIREYGKNNEYDCLLGLSGGVDSSFVAYYAKKLGLRALVVHLDNGWNSETSVRNIENIVRKLDFDLYTYVIDWEEFKDLQLSFLKASVIDIEMVSDHAIRSTLLKVAKEKQIKYILRGANIATESILPWSWRYAKQDIRNIKGIHKIFGSKKLKTFPSHGLATYLMIKYTNIYRFINLLNYIDYERNKTIDILKTELDWKYVGKKHYESIITRFYQGYILPIKFNVDKRKCHFSSMICSGQMTREQALEELQKPIYDIKKLHNDKEYVAKKFGLSEEEFDNLMKLPVKSHLEYPNSQLIYKQLNLVDGIINVFRKLLNRIKGILLPSLFIKI